MKYTALQMVVLAAVVALVVLIAEAPVAGHWGAVGTQALHAAALICLAAALAAAIPLGLAATYWRQYAPQVAFAGTAIRMLGTAALGLAYQTLADPHLPSFLTCLFGVYITLLLVETVLIVYIVKRVYPQKASEGE